MKTVLSVAFLFLFVCADAQTGTITVKKKGCECTLTDSLVDKGLDPTKLTVDTTSSATLFCNISDSLTGKPLPGASIYYILNGKKVSFTSNSKGDFILKDLVPGSYDIYAIVPCYYMNGYEVRAPKIPHKKGDVQFNIFLLPCKKAPVKTPGVHTKRSNSK